MGKNMWVRAAAACCAISLPLALSACGDNELSPYLSQNLSEQQSALPANKPHLSGEFAGAGASSQKSAVDAWIVGFSASQPQTAISYDPSGSGAGVNTFLTGAVSWAGTDAPLSRQQLESSRSVCQGKTAFDIPVYISPIAVVYNLSAYGLNSRKNPIRLSPGTLAKIFTGSITRWNDPAIKKENPSLVAKLPDISVTPVWRSDKSGTTKVFQNYLKEAAPAAWSFEPSETWPNSVGQGAKGTSGVVLTASQAQGTIGYADAAQASNLGRAAVKVGSSYVSYSAAATSHLISKSPLSSKDKGPSRYVIDVDFATSDSASYPIALVSYAVACPVYSPARRQTADFIKQWLTYVVSPQGQKLAAENAGSVPLSPQVRKEIMKSISRISSGSSGSSGLSESSKASGSSGEAR